MRRALSIFLFAALLLAGYFAHPSSFLPGMSGRDVAVRLHEKKPGLKVIFASRYSSEMAGRELSLPVRAEFHPEALLVERASRARAPQPRRLARLLP